MANKIAMTMFIIFLASSGKILLDNYVPKIQTVPQMGSTDGPFQILPKEVYVLPNPYPELHHIRAMDLMPKRVEDMPTHPEPWVNHG